jgi:hypothetical protein
VGGGVLPVAAGRIGMATTVYTAIIEKEGEPSCSSRMPIDRRSSVGFGPKCS